MISCSTVRKDEIRWHYDLITVFYRLLWGRHIHHGLWNGSESAPVAQQHLMETLAREGQIQTGARVLDVGCGMGGSSIFLARDLACRVTGVTLSPVQRRWAACAARWHGVCRSTDFLCTDIEHAVFAPAAFDTVWSIECTEHLFDKPGFFCKVEQWLAPGGRLAFCAWLTGDAAEGNPGLRQQVEKVCEGFLCPSLGTRKDYADWIQQAGMIVTRYHDWTTRVLRTWEICLERVRRTGLRTFARLIDRSAALFVEHFETILEAYRSGALSYGCFVAERPGRIESSPAEAEARQ